MKKNLYLALLLSAGSMLFQACQKDHEFGNKTKSGDNKSVSPHAKKYSNEVVVKWLDMQLRILRVPGPPSGSATRSQAYCGIALYESVLPGMPLYRSLDGQLNALPALPKSDKQLLYHWPACANAALAFMNRNLLSATSDANKTSMDSLENALNSQFQTEVDAATLARSNDFGRAIAQVIFDWSKTDGTFDPVGPYTPPGSLPNAAPGLWTPTPPNNPAAVNPYGGNIRLLVAGSNANSEPAPPPSYSEDVNSEMYLANKEVYDISQNLTADQIALALFFRDAPGYPASGHYISIFRQVIAHANATLETAAVSYAKTGISIQDASITCFKTKYTINRERPVSYIRRVLLKSGWLPLFNTPGHPEFPSAHSNQGGAMKTALEDDFGKKFQFTDHSYDYLGMNPQTFESFDDMAVKAGLSRVYGGIHYRASCEKGKLQGETVSQNVLSLLKFH